MPKEKDLLGLRAYAYLRKSRMEEGVETEEVLRRHRQALEECAQFHGLEILEYFPEVVSGESLYARPQMLRLLEAVEAGTCEAVLCMDLDRLSRGRMKDQGIILDAFKDSGTLIVTPEKVYDLSDEIDGELAEFKTFMSRREYKIINKRLRRGLKRSIQEGCYVANAPYGYRKTTVDRKPTLKIFEPEAKFVRIMFDMYQNGYGCTAIANHVSAMGAKPHRSSAFSRNSIAKILRNPTYIGKIVWDQKTHIKKQTRGNPKHIILCNPPEKWTVTNGLHPPLITEAVFQNVQKIMEGRYRPAYNDGTIKSPLAGLVKCANCGGNLQRITVKGQDYLICPRKGCCAAAKFEFVESSILLYLEEALSQITIRQPAHTQNLKPLEDAAESIRREVGVVQRQKARLHELLELGEYDLATYRERMAAVMEKLSALERRQAEAQTRLEQAKAFEPGRQAQKIQAVLDAYQNSGAPHRNALLHSVIQCVLYRKEKKTKPQDFHLKVLLKTF